MAGHNHGTKNYSLPDEARKSPHVKATMPRELQEELRAEAERRGKGFSAVLTEAAREWLERHRGEDLSGKGAD